MNHGSLLGFVDSKQPIDISVMTNQGPQPGRVTFEFIGDGTPSITVNSSKTLTVQVPDSPAYQRHVIEDVGFVRVLIEKPSQEGVNEQSAGKLRRLTYAIYLDADAG